jgi:hypothetical protein
MSRNVANHREKIERTKKDQSVYTVYTHTPHLVFFKNLSLVFFSLQPDRGRQPGTTGAVCVCVLESTSNESSYK